MADVTHKHLILMSVLFLVLLSSGLGGFYYYYAQTLQRLTAEYDTKITGLATTLKQTEGALRYYIKDSNDALKGDINGKITSLGKTVSDTRAALFNEIEDTRTTTQQSFQQLSGRLNETEKQSQERLDELSANLKTIRLASKDFSALVPEVLPAIVSIRVTADSGARMGSGAFTDDRGYVVTNEHVIRNATSITLKTADGASYAARVVAFDVNADIAVLATDVPSPHTLAFARYVNVGEKVIALGSPAGLEFTVTEGIVSRTNILNAFNVKLVQTDAAVNQGSSGGPLLNIAGEIIGITSSKRMDLENVGFAIHADTARTLSEGMIADDNQH